MGAFLETGTGSGNYDGGYKEKSGRETRNYHVTHSMGGRLHWPPTATETDIRPHN